MSRHERLSRNFTHCTIRHSDRVKGFKFNGGIFLSNQAAGQLGMREPVKRTDGEGQATPGYASWRKENFHL